MCAILTAASTGERGCFVLKLGYSRKSVRLLVFRSSARVWAELHEKAFRRLGGSTRIVVSDNLREGVLAPRMIATLSTKAQHILTVQNDINMRYVLFEPIYPM